MRSQVLYSIKKSAKIQNNCNVKIRKYMILKNISQIMSCCAWRFLVCFLQMESLELQPMNCQGQQPKVTYYSKLKSGKKKLLLPDRLRLQTY